MSSKKISSKAKRVVRKRKLTKSLQSCSSKENCDNYVPRKLARELIERCGNKTDFRKELIKRYQENKQSKSLESFVFTEKEKSQKICKLVQEKEKLQQELKLQQKRTKELEKQLVNERTYYEEQKWKYVQEMRQKHNLMDSFTQTPNNSDMYDSDESSSLGHELRKVRLMFHKQRLITCKICEKFVKLRDYKNKVVERLKKAETIYGMLIEQLMKHLAEARISFATLERGGELEKKKIDDLADRVAKLAYNNAALHMELLRQQKEIDIIKSKDFNHISSESLLSSKTCGCCSGGSDITLSMKGSVISVPITVYQDGKLEQQLTPVFETVLSQESDLSKRKNKRVTFKGDSKLDEKRINPHGKKSKSQKLHINEKQIGNLMKCSPGVALNEFTQPINDAG